jgi:hypothetical protein
MNLEANLSNFENAESLLGEIEANFIVPENDKPVLLKLLGEYLSLKDNGLPSSITEKWNEVRKVIETLASRLD